MPTRSIRSGFGTSKKADRVCVSRFSVFGNPGQGALESSRPGNAGETKVMRFGGARDAMCSGNRASIHTRDKSRIVKSLSFSYLS